MDGYIKLHRCLYHHDLWIQEPFTKGQAWVDLLFMASYTTRTLSIRGNEIQYERGQLIASERYLSDRWRWSRNKVRRFFDSLRKREMVIQQKTKLCTCTTIINYDNYQLNDTTDDTTERPQKDQNNKGKERREEKTPSKNGKFNPEDDHLFMEFWKKYPRKVARAEAYKAWGKNRCGNGVYDDVMKGLENYVSGEWKDRDKKHIPHASTWINGARWKDEIESNGDDGWI